MQNPYLHSLQTLKNLLKGGEIIFNGGSQKEKGRERRQVDRSI